MRVKQCCCGCSLQTGTLILLWLSLLGNVGQIVKGLVYAFSPIKEHSTVEIGMLLWYIIGLVFIIYALVGVEKKRPSFMLPYIIFSVMGLISMVIIIFFVWIGSIAARDIVINAFGQDVEKAQKVSDLLMAFAIFLLICLAIGSYFTIVIYSYYKQLQEELSGVRTDGVIYGAPPDQNSRGMAYNDHPPGYGAPTVPYTQQIPVYPPQNQVYPHQLPGQKQ